MKILSLVAVVLFLSSCERMDFETEAKESRQSIQKDHAGRESSVDQKQNEKGVENLGIPREEWSTTQKKCISVCTNTSCAVPPPVIVIPTIPAIYSDFVEAFDNGSLWSFFENVDYSPLWDLSEDEDVTDGIIDGPNRLIKVTTDGVDYFLVGPDSNTDIQIENDPLLVLYLDI